MSMTIYRAVDEPDTYWVAGVFETEESYRANVASPEQHRRWQQVRSALEAEPEWHDGHILFHGNEPDDTPPPPQPRAGA